MPDGDYLRYRLTAVWRKVLRSLEHKDASGRVEDLVVKALAATVRDAGGVPNLHETATAVHQACSSDNSMAPYEAFGPTVRRNVLDRLGEQVAQAMAATMQSSLALTSPANAAELFARKLLERVARHSGLDRMVPYLVEEGKYSAPQLNELVLNIFQGSQMEKLAKNLVRYPTGDGLRAPRKVSKSRSLDELMDTNLEDV